MSGIERVQEAYGKVIDNVGKVLVGRTDIIKLAFISLLGEGHVLLEGVPGVAKTLTAKAFARSLGLSFKRLQFTPDMLPSDITGTFVFDPKERQFVFREGPVFVNVLVADEINRATPKTQSALLEGMQEKQVTVEGYTRKLEEPFIVLATQNPIELEGTYPLPEAQLDRFMFRVIFDIPSLEEEKEILRKSVEGADIEEVEQVLSPQDVLEARNVVKKEVYSSQEVIDYVVSIVSATRRDKTRVLLGGSPRASVQLLAASRALATLEGRNYVTPDDVKTLVFHTLNHRVLLTPEYALRSGMLASPLSYDKIREVINDAVHSAIPPR